MSAHRLWIPDASWVCAALTLVYCLFITDGWRQLFRDSDTGWHIRTGASIVDTRSLPVADPYSFTRAGQPWVAWEWGSDVITAIAHRSGGLAGVAVLYASAIAGAAWMYWQLTWMMGGDFLLGWLFAAPMLSTTNLHWLARPHVFGWLFTLAAVWIAEKAPAKPTLSLSGMALLSIVWTNLHASFFLLPLILLLYAIGDWVAARMFIQVARTPRTAWLLSAAAISALATLVNPYGWHVHQHLVEYLSNSELIDRIGEFQSFNFHAAGAGQILLALMLSLGGGVLALTQGRVSRFLLAMFFAALAMRSARGLPLVALIGLPVANSAIRQAIQNAGGLKDPVARRLRGLVAYSSRLRGFDRQFGGWALTPFLLAVVILIARTRGIQAHAGFSPSAFPVAASAEVAKLPLNARILAPDKYGGYLIFRFKGQRKVFFDGRSDFYGSAFMKNYISLVEVRPNWQEELAQYRFSHALLPNDYSLIPALLQKGWRRLYNDEVATLLTR